MQDTNTNVRSAQLSLCTHAIPSSDKVTNDRSYNSIPSAETSSILCSSDRASLISK